MVLDDQATDLQWHGGRFLFDHTQDEVGPSHRQRRLRLLRHMFGGGTGLSDAGKAEWTTAIGRVQGLLDYGMEYLPVVRVLHADDGHWPHRGDGAVDYRRGGPEDASGEGEGDSMG